MVNDGFVFNLLKYKEIISNVVRCRSWFVLGGYSFFCTGGVVVVGSNPATPTRHKKTA